MPSNAYLVLGTVPANNEQQVPVNTKLKVSFAKHMDEGTLHEGNLRFRKVNGDAVAYTLTYDRDSMSITLVPKEVLTVNTQYQLEVIGGTSGIKSITNDYLPTSRKYEFTTIQSKAISEPRNLILTQKDALIQVKWEIPAETNENEQIYYEVQLSTSQDPDVKPLWNMKDITDLAITIPKEVELGTNYYVMARAFGGEFRSAWVIAQIYMEKPKDPEKPTDPTNPGGGNGGNIFNQIEITEISPSHGSIAQVDEVLVAFSQPIKMDALPEHAVYVVQTPYKDKLTALDKLGAYSVKHAVEGTVSLVADTDNILSWKPANELLKEKPYVVIVDKAIKGTGDPLGVTKMFGFNTPWERFYGRVDIVKSLLGEYASGIKDVYIYETMHGNSQYAYEKMTKANPTAIEAIDKGEIPFYLHKYVEYKSAYDLLLGQFTSQTRGGAEKVKLGLLEVEHKFDLKKATSILDELRKQLEEWEELVMGNKSKFALPKGAVKGESGAPYPEFLQRAEFKELK